MLRKLPISRLPVLVFVLGSFVSQVYAQGSPVLYASSKTRITGGQGAQTYALLDLLKDLEKKFNVVFDYDKRSLKGKTITVLRDQLKSSDVSETLNAVLPPLGLEYKKYSDRSYIIFKPKEEHPAGEKASDGTPQQDEAPAPMAESVPSGQPASAEALLAASISGTIIDDTGSPMPGVNVIVKGTTVGTSTDADGKYILDVADENAVLVFSFIGYETMEIPVANRSVIDVTMIPDINTLSEVVVVGYGEVKKRDLTGAVSSLKGEEVTKIPSTTIVESLQGKVAGADITRSNGYAGQGATIRIRGNRSISNPDNSNNVLFIVDGIQGVNPSDINANDIQSIEVLKDASSTAIYGSRGANGVIIITTKRGTSEKATLTYNSYVGVSQVSGYGEYMDGPEYVAMRREAHRATGNWTGPADDFKVFEAPVLAAIQNEQYIDWPDQLLHTGLQQDHQIGIAGGSEKTKVYFSAGYFNEKGILKNDEYDRYSARLNVDQTINRWLKVGMQSQFAFIDNDKRRDPFNVASKIAPLGTAYDANGQLIFFPAQGSEVNPLADEQPNAWDQNVKANRLSLSTYLQVDPLKDLSIRSTFGANFNNSTEGKFYAKNSIDGKGTKSQSSVTNNQTRFISWENVISYNKTIGDHTFGLTGVASYLSNVNTSSYAGGNNQLYPSQLYYSLTSASQNGFYGSGYNENTLISFTGRLNYSWKGKYLATITGRNDGSSKLGEGNKWAFFPSAALAWRIIDENFMKDQSFLSELKLRVSYGRSGNDVITPYTTQNALSQIQFSYDDATAAIAYAPSATLGNRDLKWEITGTYDIGLDFGFLDDRITGSFDYYDARTTDLLFSYNMPPSSGVTKTTRNMGETRNRGIELSINAHTIDKEDFSWRTGITFFRNKEEIVELPNGNVYDNDYRKSLIIGEPASVFYDYQKTGIWQLGEEADAAIYGSEPGDIKFRDISGPDGVPDGKITAAYDRTVIGTTVPKWSGGLNNDFRYKGFDLNIYFFARIGQWISSDYYAKYNRNGKNNGARVDYWTPENPTNDYPRPHATKNIPIGQSTLSLYEASYVKLRNITLGYTLPQSITSRYSISNLRVYVSGRNLYSFSKNNDFDPESEGATDHPLNRLYVAGINLTF